MATIAVGDIHGHLAQLDDLLSRALPLLAADDHLVFLGDYVDRGPDTRGVIERLLRVKAEAPCRVVFLLGNHEEWLLTTRRDFTRHSWLTGMERSTTVASYSPDAAALLRAELSRNGVRLVTERVPLPYERFFDAVPAAHLAFLDGLVRGYRTPDVVCVHGGLDPLAGPLEAQDPHALTWGDGAFPDAYDGADVVVYGHMNDAVVGPDGRPGPRVTNGRAWGIDSIAHGVLTAVRFPDGLVLQSRAHA